MLCAPFPRPADDPVISATPHPPLLYQNIRNLSLGYVHVGLRGLEHPYSLFSNVECLSITFLADRQFGEGHIAMLSPLGDVEQSQMTPRLRRFTVCLSTAYRRDNPAVEDFANKCKLALESAVTKRSEVGLVPLEELVILISGEPFWSSSSGIS